MFLGGWMDEWMGEKAVLRIACSNQKRSHYESTYLLPYLRDGIHESFLTWFHGQHPFHVIVSPCIPSAVVVRPINVERTGKVVE